jgi:hypothetical protein
MPKKNKRGYWHGRRILTEEEAAEMDFPYPPEPDWADDDAKTERLIEEAEEDKKHGRLTDGAEMRKESNHE